MSLSHGEIRVHDGSASQSFTTTPAKLTAFTANGPHASSEGGDQSITPDVANDKIKVLPGVYQVSFSGSFRPAEAARWQFHLRAEGAEQTLACEVEAVDYGEESGVSEEPYPTANGSFSGVADLAGVTPGTDGFIDLEVYGESDDAGGAAVTTVMAQLSALRID